MTTMRPRQLWAPTAWLRRSERIGAVAQCPARQAGVATAQTTYPVQANAPGSSAPSRLVCVCVCAPGGRVLATEFCWRTPPSPAARVVFLGQVCLGMSFGSVQDWVDIYSSAGLVSLQTESGRFEMITPRGFLADEGLAPEPGHHGTGKRPSGQPS
jgi:hypothetical protein